MNLDLDNSVALVSCGLWLLSVGATLLSCGICRGRRGNLPPLSATVCVIALCYAMGGETALGFIVGQPYLDKPSLVLAYPPVHYIDLLDDSASETINVDDDTSLQRIGEPNKYTIGANALADFIEHHRGDRIALTTFSETPLKVTTLSSTTYDTSEKLSHYQPRYHETDLAAAIGSAIEQFKEDSYTGPKVLIVTSDGIDTIEPTLLNKFTSDLLALHVRVFAVVVSVEDEAYRKKLAQDLETLVKHTNGASFVTNNRHETENAYARIGDLTRPAPQPIPARVAWLPLMALAFSFMLGSVILLTLLVTEKKKS